MPLNFKILFSITVFTSFFISCESDFDIKNDFDKKMVLNVELVPNRNIRVLLTENRPTQNKNELTIIKDAAMELLVNDTLIYPIYYSPNITDSINHSGYYVAEYQPKPMDKVTINAKHKSFPELSATEQIPSEITLNEFTLLSHPLPSDKSIPAKLKISFKDSPDKDYYLMDIWYISYEKKYDSLNSTYFYEENYIFDRDEYVEGLAFTETLWGNKMFDDLNFEGQNVSFDVTITNPVKPKSGNKLFMYIDFRKVSEAYFLYEKSFALSQSEIYDPFKEPVFVYSNVTNGYGIMMSWTNDFERITILE